MQGSRASGNFFLIRCSGNISVRNLFEESVLNARRRSAWEEEETPPWVWERAPRLPGWLTQRTEHHGEAELGSGGRMGSGAASKGLCHTGHRRQDFSLTTVENQLMTSNREMTLHGGGQPLKDDSCCLVEHRSRGSKETGQKTGAAVQKKHDSDWTGRSQQRWGEARHLVTRF